MEGFQGSRDPITAVTAALHMLLIGRASGEILVFTLPDLVPAGNVKPCQASSTSLVPVCL